MLIFRRAITLMRGCCHAIDDAATLRATLAIIFAINAMMLRDTRAAARHYFRCHTSAAFRRCLLCASIMRATYILRALRYADRTCRLRYALIMPP